MLFALFQSPLDFLFLAIALVVAITVHEFFHAWVSNFLGDPTAKAEGRISLNPLVHLDPLGTLMIFLAGFGWGKPVPYNPNMFKNSRLGAVTMALAGPLSNFILAFISAGLLRLFFSYLGGTSGEMVIRFLLIFIQLNLLLMIFNLIPLPPLDGSKLLYLLPGFSFESMLRLEQMGPFLLFGLIILDRMGAFPLFERIIIPALSFIMQKILLVN